MTKDFHVDADCPHCHREERFDDGLSAHAWITGHIREEHSDTLPRFSNEESR